MPQGLKHYLAIVCGLGGLGRGHGYFQGLAEPKDAALAEIILELVFGPVNLGLQVGFVAVQGGGAEAVPARVANVAEPLIKAWSMV